MNSTHHQIREARKSKKMTLQAASAKLKIDVAILSKMERGLRPISESQLKAICDLYQIDLLQLQKAIKAEEIVQLLKGYNQQEEIEILKLAEKQLLYLPTKKLKIQDVKNPLRTIFKKFQSIQKAWIFGSFARGENNESSDIDIVIEADHGFSYFELADVQYQAEEKLKIKIDIGFRNSSSVVKSIDQQELKLIFNKKVKFT
jgi:predicted nucleotidyltransferase